MSPLQEYWSFLLFNMDNSTIHSFKSISTWLKSENIFLFATPSPPHDVIRNLIFGLNGSNFDLLRTINSGKKCFDQTWDLPPFSASNWFSGNCHRGNISRNTIYIFTFLKLLLPLSFLQFYYPSNFCHSWVLTGFLFSSIFSSMRFS